MIPQVFFRCCLLTLTVLFIVPCTSAWTFGSWSGPEQQAQLLPGTPVTVSYSMSFSSYDTGTTFDSENSLVMYTDLADPQWVVTKTEMVDDTTPLKTDLASRKVAQVRLDGWDLSFSRKQFTINARLDGKIPSLTQSKEIMLVRIQEMTPDAKVVPGTLIKKVAVVSVPTPEPTAAPVVQVQETVLEITPEPITTIPAIVPTRKQTYSPGPDPLVICGILAALVIIPGLLRRRE